MDGIDWLLTVPEPWTRYRALIDLLDLAHDDGVVVAARTEMLAHPSVQAIIVRAAGWGAAPLKRHNDAAHALTALGVLADFGLQQTDPGMAQVIEKVLAHQSADGPFQTPLNVPTAFGGTGQDQWTWMSCDAPTLLYALLSFGLGGDPPIQSAVDRLAGLVDENGYRCVSAPELGRFRGPGRKTDPCPVANVYALKALSLVPGKIGNPVAHLAAEMLLSQWAQRKEKKYFLFGMGTDFKKLKYPYVYFDILHVVEALSRFSFVHGDLRFCELLELVVSQADSDGRYTAGSMYQAWKGWSFADKKSPSPWLTLLVLRIQKRVERAKKNYIETSLSTRWYACR